MRGPSIRDVEIVAGRFPICAKARSYLVLSNWYLAKRTQAIVAISEIQKKELTQTYKVCKPEQTHVIPLGFDLERFTEDVELKRKNFRTPQAIRWRSSWSAFKMPAWTSAPDLSLDSTTMTIRSSKISFASFKITASYWRWSECSSPCQKLRSMRDWKKKIACGQATRIAISCQSRW